MGQAYATLDGYTVRKVTPGGAIGINKSNDPFGTLTFLPIAACMDGDALGVGDTDIIVPERLADDKGLEYS